MTTLITAAKETIVHEAKGKKSKMIRSLAAPSTLYYQIRSVLPRKLKEKHQGG